MLGRGLFNKEIAREMSISISTVKHHVHHVLGKRLCRSKPVGENWLMVPLHVQLMNSTFRGVLKRLHFPLEVMLVCVRWYALTR